MAQTDQVQDTSEPSIEEILASIRKIISEDDPPSTDEATLEAEPANNDAPAMEPVSDMPAPIAAESVVELNNAEEDVLELTDFLEEEPLELTEIVEEKPVEVVSTPIPEPVKIAEPKPMPIEEPKSWQDTPSETLISKVSENVATEAMARLARTAHQTTQRPQADRSALSVSSRSLDEIVEDMLRPMLSEWLDGNLPLLVEKLVERELNRMARRAEDKAEV